jgi:hypothetical protein
MSEYKEYTVRVYKYKTVWLVNGKRHREDAPAVEWSDGTRFWYLDGKRHRIGGPAFEWQNGCREWFYNDRRHRLDGPAIEGFDRTKGWWIDGVQLSEDEFNRRVNPAPCDGKVVEIEGRKYRLVAE